MTLSGSSLSLSAKRMLGASALLLGGVMANSALADATWQQATVDMVGVENFFGERCIAVQAGQTIQYRYTSAHPLDFNIHQHPDHNNIIFLRKEENLASLSGNFLADKDDHYCFTWSNTADRGGVEWKIALDYQITNP